MTITGSSPAVESRDDPAFALLTAEKARRGAPLEIVVAGLAERAGQKVWNQLAALDRLTPEDEIVAFIDADTAPTPLWLPRLVAVLVNSGRPVATGYRWMIPADARASSCGLAAANNAIAALPRGSAADAARLGRQRRDAAGDAGHDPDRRFLARRNQ